MNCVIPGFPGHHQHLKLAQTHVHWVSDDIQPSYPVIPFSPCLQSSLTTGKTIILTRPTFDDKVMSLLFNMLSRSCHSFSSKKQVSFNFMAAVTICRDFGDQENNICHCFHFFPIYLPLSDGTGCHDLLLRGYWVFSVTYIYIFFYHQ